MAGWGGQEGVQGGESRGQREGRGRVGLEGRAGRVGEGRARPWPIGRLPGFGRGWQIGRAVHCTLCSVVHVYRPGPQPFGWAF